MVNEFSPAAVFPCIRVRGYSGKGLYTTYGVRTNHPSRHVLHGTILCLAAAVVGPHGVDQSCFIWDIMLANVTYGGGSVYSRKNKDIASG